MVRRGILLDEPPFLLLESLCITGRPPDRLQWVRAEAAQFSTVELAWLSPLPASEAAPGPLVSPLGRGLHFTAGGVNTHKMRTMAHRSRHYVAMERLWLRDIIPQIELVGVPFIRRVKIILVVLGLNPLLNLADLREQLGDVFSILLAVLAGLIQGISHPVCGFCDFG